MQRPQPHGRRGHQPRRRSARSCAASASSPPTGPQLDLAEIATWDRYLLREHRLLVPIDVQALYVPPGGTEPMVRAADARRRRRTGTAVTDPEDGLPDPFDAGTPRPPACTCTGRCPTRCCAARSTQRRRRRAPTGSALPALPDRWVVLRIVLPHGRSRRRCVTGWVLEADRAVAVPLGAVDRGRRGVAGSRRRAGEPIAPRAAHRHRRRRRSSWSGVYDAVLNRFAFHDPLADIAALAPQRRRRATAPPTSSPAGGATPRSTRSTRAQQRQPARAARAAALAPAVRMGRRAARRWQQEQGAVELRKALGLTTADRWSSPRAGRSTGAAARAAAGAARAFVPVGQDVPRRRHGRTTASVFATEAGRRFVAPPWHLRSSLLHGAIYGVPVARRVPRRPPARSGRRCASRSASTTTTCSPPSPRRRRRRGRSGARPSGCSRPSPRRRSTGSARPTGWSSSRSTSTPPPSRRCPAGSAGTDRYLQRVQTGGVGGLEHRPQARADAVGRRDAERALGAVAQRAPTPRRAPAAAAQRRHRATSSSPQEQADADRRPPRLMINDLARSRVGEVLAPTEARVVDRPAPRFTFPTSRWWRCAAPRAACATAATAAARPTASSPAAGRRT